MASVWKHFKSVNWFARYRGTAGKTVNRSTGVVDKKEALRIATTWEIEAARDVVKKDVSPAGISDAVARAERMARMGRLDARAARALINDMLTAAGHEQVNIQSNAQWCKDWRAAKAPTAGAKSRLQYTQVIRDWLKFLDRKAEKPIDMISKADAIAFRDSLLTAGLAPRTINQTMKLVRGIYGEAVEQGHLPRNPFTGIKPQPLDSDVKRQPFTAGEVKRILDVAEDDWKGMILLSATTGLRLLDCSRLQWRAVDLGERMMKVRTAKTGTTLQLPIHAEFFKWLVGRDAEPGPVFPSLAHLSGTGRSGLSCSFGKLMERAGVSSDAAKTGSGRGRNINRKSFHSLRHFAATSLAAAGVRADVARKITGHTDAETHSNYVGAETETLRKAVKKIRLA